MRKEKIIKNLFEELERTVGVNTNDPLMQKPSMQSAYQMQKAKETVVKFDKNTSPYEVIFSERGFQINETRFSFEFLETALSKNINIVLENGKGLVLDSVKMEKILKYKDLY